MDDFGGDGGHEVVLLLEFDAVVVVHPEDLVDEGLLPHDDLDPVLPLEVDDLVEDAVQPRRLHELLLVDGPEVGQAVSVLQPLEHHLGGYLLLAGLLDQQAGQAGAAVVPQVFEVGEDVVEEDRLQPPHPVEAEGVVLQGDQLLALGKQVDQLPRHVLEVLVASVEVDHPLDNPLLLYLVEEVAFEYPPVEGGGVGVEDRPVPLLDCGLDVLENDQLLDLPHYYF